MSIPVSSNPFSLFAEWYDAAQKLDMTYPNASYLATVDGEGMPHCRTVLLKDFDERGFVFYTNLESDKGQQIRSNWKAALCFYWEKSGKQIRINGICEVVSDEEADEYFATRPRGSQLGAWASDQSREISGRAELEAKLKELEKQYEGKEVPRPPHWSGFRIIPRQIEFWQEGEYRLHDRVVYTHEEGQWNTKVLSP